MIYVIRHGQTDINKEGRMQGKQGLALNDYGIKQAEALREKLQDIKFDLVFSSPQERAMQTAKIATGLEVISDKRLDVYDVGEADGLNKAQVKMLGPIPDPTVYKGVENVDSYIKRIFGFMYELQNEYGQKEANIFISGHRCTTGCIGAYFEGMPIDGNILTLSSNNGECRVYHFHGYKY
ncbi:histidine phosphatase family protein [Bacillus sp. FJAT-22090]|uniref:histidine phosphatase family protein n=1 Tax=Bacillus sp. FJAT-22090 TaxID=1581038 RepID=UPI00119F222F|nr:histidine phosphatase family protein [Bacillus sp. FJAT-22090]